MTKQSAEQEIATFVQWWLDYSEKAHQLYGSEVHDEMHVVPPVWPTRGMLKQWVKTLNKGE